MKKTVHSTVQRRFRVELSKNDLLTMMRTHDGSRLLPPDTMLPEKDVDIDVTVDDDHYVDHDAPLVLTWTTTEVSEASNG